ncbi:MAG: M20/M25/M40 family metallo-hydrolase [Candidatus Thermoplasmatota archaeon]
MPTDLLELTKRLIQIPSICGHEDEIAEFIASKLKGSVEMQHVEGAGPNVLARGWSERAGLLLCGHMDTVPPTQGCERDPFTPLVVHDRLHGLGAADMKAGLACAIALYNEHVDALPIAFLATADEEGQCRGVFRYLEDDPRHDLCIVLEPTGAKALLGARGRYVLEIVVHGRAAHGARPEEGINAIEEAGRVIERLRGLKPRRHRLLGEGSKCILKIEGGGDSLTVPGECMIRLDRHVVPGESKEDVWKEVQQCLSGAGLRYALRWMPRPTPFLEAYITSKSALVKRFLTLSGAEEGYAASVGDYNALGARMPTLIYGPKGGGWHTDEEHVEIHSIQLTAEVMRGFLRTLRL